MSAFWSSSLLCLVLALPAQPFPHPGPVADANPSVRHPETVRVPTRLRIVKRGGPVAYEIDPASFETVQITIGEKMITGVSVEVRFSAPGYSSPSQPWLTSTGEQSSGIQFDNLSISIEPAKLPAHTNFELDLTIFETDIPPQHMWRPAASTRYKIVWHRELQPPTSSESTAVRGIERVESRHDLASAEAAISDLEKVACGTDFDSAKTGLACDVLVKLWLRLIEDIDGFIPPAPAGRSFLSLPPPSSSPADDQSRAYKRAYDENRRKVALSQKRVHLLAAKDRATASLGGMIAEHYDPGHHTVRHIEAMLADGRLSPSDRERVLKFCVF
ncbi:hypothetical protein SAMN05421770_101612 [Granulicella rosea]|uniref:Uncharacterized protein n=1 Tax=Granulicella rosea TaxID=474952 RepID=A0A239DQT8_9BACT|nr:hypothetical protein [Granulicella rosea]SNS35005.1 hypothetical protein SAMN05421770_101612 [Granulicella rosea]